MNAPVNADAPMRGVSPWLAYALALALAAIQIWWLFPVSFLEGRGLFFFDGDIVKDITGWLFFNQEPWRLPLLYTPSLNYPDGISIAFTDSIPLMALLFKPFVASLPPGFHYFGWWHAVAFAGQALGAVFLVRALGCRGLLAAIAATLFALNWPVLLYRFGHSALLAQGTVLFALGCYFHASRGTWSAARAAVALSAVCQLALLIHPYLLAMCYAVLAAFVLDEGLRAGQWLLQLRRLLTAMLISLALAGVLGFFAGGLSTGGYGQYALGLNALWCGGDTSVWFTCSAGGGESYAYLGAGLLLMLPIVMLAEWRAVLSLPRRFPGLVLVCVLLTLYAVTNRVVIGQTVVYEFALPALLHQMFSIFQASARFFWPVGYLLLFGALAVLLQRGWVGALVVILALAIQWYDIGQRRDDILVAARAAEQPFDAGWQRAMHGVDHVAMYPAFGCGDLDRFAYLPVQYLAAHHGATFNTVYAARSTTDCKAKHALFQQDVQPDQLFVAPAALPAQALPPAFRTAAQHGQCATLPIAPVFWGVARAQDLLACRARPVEQW